MRQPVNTTRGLVRRSFAMVAIAVGLAGFSAHADAQAVPNTADAVEMRKLFMTDFDTLNVKLMALAEAIPADKYSWRPGPGVRSVGEVFMHVASEYYVYTPLSFGAPRSPLIAKGQAAMTKFEQMSTKPEVLKHLKDGFAYATTSVNAVPSDSLTGERKIFGGNYTIMETSIGMLADMHEHLGQLIAYARENGIKPPWTK